MRKISKEKTEDKNMRKDRKKKGRISPVLVVVLLIVLIAAAGVVSFLVQS